LKNNIYFLLRRSIDVCKDFNFWGLTNFAVSQQSLQTQWQTSTLKRRGELQRPDVTIGNESLW
jgi:hypothetical protein